jgi:hypothetical protein
MKILTQIILIISFSFALSPKEIVYQGILADPKGTAFADNSYSLTFSFYDISTGGTTLWTETQIVTVSKGVFSATIGSATSGGIPLPFDNPYWLGIVYNGKELSPRIKLGTSAYSFRSAVADSAVKSQYALSAGTVDASSHTHSVLSKKNKPLDTALFVDTNGYVGIGTTKPISKCYLADSINNLLEFRIRNYDDTRNAAWSRFSVIGGYGGISLERFNAGFPPTGSAIPGVGRLVSTGGAGLNIVTTNGPIRVYTSGKETSDTTDERMRITTTGNIGIGTTKPQTKFHLQDSSAPALRISKTGTTIPDSSCGKLQFSDENATDTRVYGEIAGVRLNGSNAGALSFKTRTDDATEPNEKMRISSNGFVGIGTPTPAAPLHLNFSRPNGTNSTGIILSDNSSGHPQVAGFGSGIEWYTNNYALRAGIFFQAAPDGTNNQSQITFKTASSAATYVERMKIDANGNVGIGTTSPNYSLVVSGNGKPDGTRILVNETTKPAAIITSTPNTAFIFGTEGDNGGELLPGSTSKQCIINSVGVYPMLFATNNVERMRIDGNGRVGIGTKSPAAKLHINNGQLWLLGDTTPGRIVLGEGAENPQYGDLQWDSINNSMRIKTADTNNPLILQPLGGKVGIGKTPSYTLDVNGPVYSLNNLLTSDLRFKTSVYTIPDALAKIDSIRGVYYHWNISQFPERNFPAAKQIGVIAQEVEKIIPEIVDTDANGYKSVSYEKLSVVLIEAVKEQKNTIDNLKNDVEMLKQEKDLQNKTISELLKKMNSIEQK